MAEMSYEDLVAQLELFFSEAVYDDVLNCLNTQDCILIDFQKLELFNVELSDYMLENPEEFFKACEEALTNSIDIDWEDEENQSKINVRFYNLPDHLMIPIKNLRSKHLNKFIGIEGVIKLASEVRPEITMAIFECSRCGERIAIIQEKESLKKPSMCSCGNRRGFELVGRRLTDIQRIIVEELPEKISGAQPAKISVFLRDDLVDPKFQKRVMPGTKVRVYGILRDTPISIGKEKETKRRDLYIEANYIEPIEMEFEEIEITEEDEKKIKELAKRKDIYELLVKSIAPSIYGYEDIKEAIALQLFGGVRKERKDGTISRGDIHILIVGDPGAGKSAILKYVAKLAPKARYVVGRGSTASGLTATVVRDEFLRGWALEAGALVLANKGIAIVDEIDKMSNEDRVAMHEIMEQQTCSVAKANIQATLQAQTTILAAANPKFGRFDIYTPLAEQINLPETLLSRFDLIFAVRDEPDPERDKRLVDHILKLHESLEGEEPPIDLNLLRKYIAYARKNVSPVLGKSAQETIANFYVGLRKKYATGETTSVPIGTRQLEAIIRLAEASAKVRLAKKVTKKDAERAIRLVKTYLMKLGVDPETGFLDIDRLETGISSSQRNKIKIILGLIEKMQEELPDKCVPIEDLVSVAEEEGIKDAREIIEKLKRDGEIFEPKTGYVRRV